MREHLVAEHPEALVPVLPPERSLVSASDVQSMRLFLERISRHPVLSKDIELQMFIESEFGVRLFLPDICMISPVCISLTHFIDHIFFPLLAQIVLATSQTKKDSGEASRHWGEAIQQLWRKFGAVFG